MQKTDFIAKLPNYATSGSESDQITIISEDPDTAAAQVTFSVWIRSIAAEQLVKFSLVVLFKAFLPRCDYFITVGGLSLFECRHDKVVRKMFL